MLLYADSEKMQVLFIIIFLSAVKGDNSEQFGRNNSGSQFIVAV